MSFLSNIFSKEKEELNTIEGQEKPSELEIYFQQFRKNIVGIEQSFQSPYGEKEIIYTDWTASGRLYRPIEEKLLNQQYKEVLERKQKRNKVIITIVI